MHRVKVLKFGGTSMGSADAIRHVIAILRKPQRDARIAAVVVSAMSGVTNQLIEIAERASAKDPSYIKLIRDIERRHVVAMKTLVRKPAQAQALAAIRMLIDSLEGVARGIFLLHELSPGGLDYIMSYGERLSAHLLTDALKDRGVSAEYLNARALVTTDANFGAAAVDFKTTNKAIRTYFKTHKKMQVVTGFIAATPEKTTTTLGRGGSDYSASIFGAALNASSIEIWTDVSGVYTADPRKVVAATPISSMTYLEAAEMSYFGAKVIHPPTMRPAMERNIPIRIKNTFDPDAVGTTVAKNSTQSGTLVKGITSIHTITMLQISGSGMLSARGFSGRLFSALARARTNVILITQASSQHSISVAVAPREADAARAAIEEEFELERNRGLIDPVALERDLSVLALVGEGMKERRGIAGRLFETLGRNGINIVAIAQGSSEFNISVVIGKQDEMKALNAVHAAFFSPERKVINVFLVGTGVVGGALLQQIAEQRDILEREHGFVVRIAGLADAKRMAFEREGISARTWEKTLGRSRTHMNIGAFITRMTHMELPQSVFVDCTPSEAVAARYVDILGAGISIVTPNKRANSGTYEYYRALKAQAAKHGVKFLYETNVGAGLPILSTLRDLLLSGDRVRRIEAVLSGTLSYIFDNFNGTKPFSEIVREARTLGFAEPDPRSDLSGLDVARKILILAREIGLPLELKDIKVQNLLSPRSQRATSVDKFFHVLHTEDALYEKKKKAAESKGKVLRYIATLNKGKATVSLQAVDAKHPFYALYGNDNIVAFFTDRYKKSPLIIQGPGAGADVTAAGVFADILRTAAGV